MWNVYPKFLYKRPQSQKKRYLDRLLWQFIGQYTVNNDGYRFRTAGETTRLIPSLVILILQILSVIIECDQLTAAEDQPKIHHLMSIFEFGNRELEVL